jgi:DNA-damage-inducible protein D
MRNHYLAGLLPYVVDSIEVLTNSPNPSGYWRVVKDRLKKEGAAATLDEIVPLRLQGRDGKLRETDCASRQTILRLIQSIPSPHAERFKVALAALAEEQLILVEDHDTVVQRLKLHYRALHRQEDWIDQRINVLVIRNGMTDEWEWRGAHEGPEFALLTNLIHTEAFGLSVADHRTLKGLPKNEDLRDHMSYMELATIGFAEALTTTLHQDRNSQGMAELARDAREGGEAGGRARQIAEQALGRPVVTSENFLASQPPKRQVRGKKQKQDPAAQPPLLESGE